MMPDKRSDPEGYAEIWRARHEVAVQAFINDEFPMTDAVFKATLFGLGFRGQELDAEVHYYEYIKHTKTSHP